MEFQMFNLVLETKQRISEMFATPIRMSQLYSMDNYVCKKGLQSCVCEWTKYFHDVKHFSF